MPGRTTWERDLSAYVGPHGHIAAEVKISMPGGNGPEPRETGASAEPSLVARFLRELADDVERAAQ